MQKHSTFINIQPEQQGLLYGFLGVLAFSLTLPATRIAVGSFDPMLVGIVRPAIASLIAAVVLLATRQKLPDRKHLPGLFMVASGIGIGFPILAAWAMKYIPSSHGAVMLGVLPMATAIAATWRAGERPSWGFWLAGIIGSATIVGFALYRGAGHFQIGDILLFAALIFGALGYAEGGRLSRELGGWQVISWALVLSAPFTLVPALFIVQQHALSAPPAAWISLGYVTVISQFLGFFPWYRGMVLAGVARVGQIQLLQPFITLLASVVLLGEQITMLTIVAALIVSGAVWFGRKAPIKRPASAIPEPLCTASTITK